MVARVPSQRRRLERGPGRSSPPGVWPGLSVPCYAGRSPRRHVILRELAGGAATAAAYWYERWCARPVATRSPCRSEPGGAAPLRARPALGTYPSELNPEPHVGAAFARSPCSVVASPDGAMPARPRGTFGYSGIGIECPPARVDGSSGFFAGVKGQALLDGLGGWPWARGHPPSSVAKVRPWLSSLHRSHARNVRARG